jgi:methylmalonyl-CoA epimerase
MKDKIFEQFKFHHIGLFVKDLDEAIKNYTLLFGSENISEIYIIASQNVKECFVKNGVNSYIGLVAEHLENSVVKNFTKKGIGYYHIAYKVENINTAVTQLEKINYKTLKPFNSEAFSGKQCVFLFTPDGHLIELIEK